MGAYPSENTGKGEVPHDDLDGLPVFSLLYHLNIALDIQVGRACHSTGRLIQLFYDKAAGNRLRVGLEGGLALGKVQIIFIWSLDRADLGAITAGRAFIPVYITGGFPEGYLKISCIAINGCYV
jgi:hypothetical protein